MANLQIKDGASSTKYLKASGAGSDGDPFIPEHSVSGTVAVSIATAPALVTGTATIGATKDAGANWTAAHLVVNSADATGGVDISAAPTSGQKRVLTDLIISVGAAMAVSILEETSGTVMHGPFYMDANTTMQITPRSTPMSKLPTADKKYRVDTSVAGNVTIETWTYSEA